MSNFTTSDLERPARLWGQSPGRTGPPESKAGHRPQDRLEGPPTKGFLFWRTTTVGLMTPAGRTVSFTPLSSSLTGPAPIRNRVTVQVPTESAKSAAFPYPTQLASTSQSFSAPSKSCLFHVTVILTKALSRSQIRRHGGGQERKAPC